MKTIKTTWKKHDQYKKFTAKDNNFLKKITGGENESTSEESTEQPKVKI